MKKYLLTSFTLEELLKLYSYFENWNIDKLKDIELNLSVFNEFKDSEVDVLYIFSKFIKEQDDLWWILSNDIYVTKNWIYYYDYIRNTFEIIKDNSELYIFRKSAIPKNYLFFLQNYAKNKFNINLVWLDDNKENLWLKRFWLYFWNLVWLENRIPDCVVPLFTNYWNKDIFIKFCNYYFGTKSIILKRSDSSWWNDIFVFKLSEKNEEILLTAILDKFISEKKFDLVVMEFLPTKDYELRVLWNNIKWNINIIWIFKKIRLEGQIFHNVCKWNEFWLAEQSYISEWMINDLKKIVKVLPDKFWWIDILIDIEGNYYFLENNKFTWYLDTQDERDYLKPWLDSMALTYLSSNNLE